MINYNLKVEWSGEFNYFKCGKIFIRVYGIGEYFAEYSNKRLTRTNKQSDKPDTIALIKADCFNLGKIKILERSGCHYLIVIPYGINFIYSDGFELKSI